MLASSRRTFISAASSALALQSLAANQLYAQVNRQVDVTAEAITPETQKAIDRGLAFLSKRQIASGRMKGAFGHGGYQGGVAVCGLAGLAFMCGGSPPGQGPYGRYVDKCAE
jgi:hypothetical protein